MQIYSSFTPKAYIRAMKDQMGSRLALGAERFTGYFIGKLFCVTYHCGYEYDRRFSNPINSALGYVKESEDGCEVRFVKLKGILNPPSFIFESLLFSVLFLITLFPGGNAIYSDFPWWCCFLLGFGITAVVAPLSALFEAMFSQRSAEGERTLLSFLLDPSDPYANYHKLP